MGDYEHFWEMIQRGIRQYIISYCPTWAGDTVNVCVHTTNVSLSSWIAQKNHKLLEWWTVEWSYAAPGENVDRQNYNGFLATDFSNPAV